MSEIQENVNLLELIDETIKKYGKNNKFKFAVAENFECHKYTHIDFSENMTVFVGESSNGKSSFMRMLDWVQYNSIRGDKHITTGETECRGIIGTFNGFIVKREITPSYNRYYVTHESWSNEFILEGFGVNVPYEVQYILGAFKVKVDDKRQNDLKLNYLEQGQGWFLTSDQYPSTVKAKAVGLLYGVHYLDQAIKDTKYELNRVTKDISSTEKEIEDLKEKAKAYDYLDEIKQMIDVVEKKYQEGVRLNNLSEKLLDLNIKYTNTCNDYNETLELLNKINENDVNYADSKVAKLQLDLHRIKNLSRISSEYKSAVTGIKTSRVVIDRGSLSDDIDSLVNGIEGEINRFKSLSKLNSDYVSTNNAITTVNKYISFDKPIKAAGELVENANQQLRVISKLLPASSELKKIDTKLINCNVMIGGGMHIEDAELMHQGIREEMERFNKLVSISKQYHDVKNEINNSMKTLGRASNIEYASERFNEADKHFLTLSRLIPRLIELRGLKRQINGLNIHLVHEDNLNVLNKEMDSANELIKRFDTLVKLKNTISRVNDEINDSDKTIKEKEKDLIEFISKYEDVIREIGVCPMCRSVITDNVIDHLMVDLRK